MSPPHDETDEERELRRELNRTREMMRMRHDALAVDERDRLRQAHWMHCPKCGAQLAEVAFRKVRVDKCFACGGVYLDDGELEQLAGRPGWFDAMRAFFAR